MSDYFSFQWHITEACDQRCSHCYIFSRDAGAPVRTMRWEAMRRTLDNCLALCRDLDRLPFFHITGGDPLLHPDIWRLTEGLHSLSIPFSLLGNPFHLDAAVCRRLAGLGCERYQLSLDGLEATHDRIRKPGSYAATLAAIPPVRDSGMKAVIMATVSADNAGEIPELIDVAVNNEADVFAFARYCAGGGETATRLGADQYREVLDRCWEKFEQHRDSGTVFNLKDHLWTLYLYEKGLFVIPEGLDDETVYDGCNCGISHLSILPDGQVYACRRMESGVGNVLEERLTDIFLGERMDPYREYDKFLKCSRCELLRFCRGCPAVACGEGGDPHAADPQCWKTIA